MKNKTCFNWKHFTTIFDSVVARALDLRSTGPVFGSHPGCCRENYPDEFFSSYGAGTLEIKLK